MDAVPTEAQKFGIERGRMMIQDRLSRHFGEDLPSVLLYFPLVYKVKVNRRIYRSEESLPAKELRQKYNLNWED